MIGILIFTFILIANPVSNHEIMPLSISQILELAQIMKDYISSDNKEVVAKANDIKYTRMKLKFIGNFIT